MLVSTTASNKSKKTTKEYMGGRNNPTQTYQGIGGEMKKFFVFLLIILCGCERYHDMARRGCKEACPYENIKCNQNCIDAVKPHWDNKYSEQWRLENEILTPKGE